jgi:anthranilate synthase
MHGKASTLTVEPGSALFRGIEGPLTVGRYHSLVADPDRLPAELAVTARSEDGAIMAVEHAAGGMLAVQFHPESIMSLGGDAGMAILDNAVTALLVREDAAEAAA